MWYLNFISVIHLAIFIQVDLCMVIDSVTD